MEVALVLYAFLALALYVLVLRPRQRRLASHRALLESLHPGDEVMTTAGIYGTIHALRDDEVELEVAPAVVLTLARAAIATRTGRLGGDEPAASPPAGVDE
jgi:preprotein translocase subunit YajC